MLRNAQQEITGIVAVMRDVTRRFEEVRELRRRLAQAGASS
jgi:signal transduction histidine kinase